MVATKKMWAVLTIVLTLGFIVGGCGDQTPETVTVKFDLNYKDATGTPADVTIEKGSTLGDRFPADPSYPDHTFLGWYDGETKYTRDTPINANITLTAQWEEDVIYSYSLDEIRGGLFGAMSPTMTLNEWCLLVTGTSPKSYDELVREGFALYKDINLETAFTGTDVIDESTIIYCDSSINNQGKKIGEITGTITLTDIPHPDTTRVYISSYSYSGWPSNWWELNRKINLSDITGTSATVNWSLPVYKSFNPPSQATFELIVLPGDSLISYEVSVPTRKTISDANANVGDLGTVSIKGVTLSGTITVAHNGEPVPYVEIFARYPVEGVLGRTCLYSPGPDKPWSVTFGPNKNKDIEMEFQVFGYSGKNGTLLFDKDNVTTTPSVVRIVDNKSISDIVIVLDAADD